MVRKLVCVFLCVALWVFAATPIATVTSSGAFKVGGVAVPATAASAFPAGIGDEINSLDTPVIVRIDDKAVITLAPHSTVKLEEQGGKIIVRLTAGSMDYKLTGADVVIFNQSKAVGGSLAGSITVASHTLPIVLASVGAAGGVIAGVAYATRSKDCPSGANCQ